MTESKPILTTGTPWFQILTGAFDRTYAYMVDAGQANLAC